MTAALPSPTAVASTLVGRDAEVTALDAALSALDGGTFLGVAGDPGIGKTRLLTELAEAARLHARLVLAGRAAEFERDVPFGVFRNAIEDHLKHLAPEQLARLGDDERRLLPSVLPGLPVPAGESESKPLGVERYRLHRAMRSLLELLAEPSGLVMIVDDLHWCDDGSAELICHLLRNPPAAPVLMALAYRPRQLPIRLHHEITTAARHGLAVLIEVGPLDPDAAAALLPGHLSIDRRQELYEASGGNPFYLELLSRGKSLGNEPAAVADHPGDDPVPLQVRDALAGEFAALPTAGRRVAHAAAVAGDLFDVALVAAVAATPHAAVLDAFDELSARDLIRPAGPRFQFRHPLLRSAAYQHAQPGWRVAAHARAAAELDRRGAPLSELAGHVELSATPGDRDAVAVLRSAAADVVHTTPSAAVRWFGSALRLLPEQPQTTMERLELLNLRARALGITGQLTESRDMLSEVLRMVPVGTEARVAVLAFLTTMEHLLGNHVAARELLTTELAVLPVRRGRMAAALHIAVVLSGVMHGGVATGEVTTAIAVARETGDGALLASALTVGSVGRLSFDLADDVVPFWVDEATGLVDGMTEAELAGRLDAALFLGWAENYLGRPGPAAHHVDRALRVARDTGQSHLISPLRILSGVIRLTTGDLNGATVALDDALESTLLTGANETRGQILVYRTWLSVWFGDVDAALAYGEEALALAIRQRSADWQSGPAEANLGLARYAAGDPEGGLEAMLRAGGGPDLPAVRQVWQPRLYEQLSAAATAAGRHRDAVGFADRARRLSAIAAGLPRHAGFIALAQVHPAMRTDPAEAARQATEAARLFALGRDRLGTAQAHLHAGAAYRAAGESQPAEREIALARQAFAACGARPEWLAQRLRIPLSASGSVPTVADQVIPDDAGTNGLTSRELAVLRLLAESLTAATIARRLEISPGTVHKHLARIYRKLGTTDRLATVLRAKALGLVAGR
jgi:DNA-binding NarL/FixJ family response regulator